MAGTPSRYYNIPTIDASADMIRNGPQQINDALTVIDNAIHALATSTAMRLQVQHANVVLTIGAWTVTTINFPTPFTGSDVPSVVVSNNDFTACPLHVEVVVPPTNTGFQCRLVAPQGTAYPAAGAKVRISYIAMKG